MKIKTIKTWQRASATSIAALLLAAALLSGLAGASPRSAGGLATAYAAQAATGSVPTEVGPPWT